GGDRPGSTRLPEQQVSYPATWCGQLCRSSHCHGPGCLPAQRLPDIRCESDGLLRKASSPVHTPLPWRPTGLHCLPTGPTAPPFLSSALYCERSFQVGYSLKEE